MAELYPDAIKARLAAWQEEPCTGGYPGMPVWPSAHGGCWFCDQKIADAAEDPIEAFSRPMIVCPECGNKRCPKARWHRNECTSSNAAKQVCDYPAPFTPADVAALVAEVERLRAVVPVIHVHHHDIEHHAASFNEGYEAAMAQHLADDPSLAEDWLNAKLAGAWVEGFRAGYADGTDTGPTGPDSPYRTEQP